MAKSCFLRRKEIQFRWYRWLSEVLARRSFSRKELLNKAWGGGGSLMVWRGGFSSSGKLKLQFVSGGQNAADYVKMLNDISLAQEGRHLCGEEWIFQQDNADNHNTSLTKKSLFEKKIRLHYYPDPNPIENLWGLIVAKVYGGG